MNRRDASHLRGIPTFKRGINLQITSNVTGLTYRGEEMVFISNPLQTARYLKNNALLYDVLQNQDKLIFVFRKSETSELFDKWCKHELL